MFTDGIEKIAAKKATPAKAKPNNAPSSRSKKPNPKAPKKPTGVRAAFNTAGDYAGRGAGHVYNLGSRTARNIDKGLAYVGDTVGQAGKGFVKGFKRAAGINKMTNGRFIYRHPLITAGAVIGASKWLASDSNKENKPAEIMYSGQG